MGSSKVLATAKLRDTRIRKLKHDLLFLEVGKFVDVQQRPSTVKDVFDVEIVTNGALDGDITKNLFGTSLTSGMLHRKEWDTVLTPVS